MKKINELIRRAGIMQFDDEDYDHRQATETRLRNSFPSYDELIGYALANEKALSDTYFLSVALLDEFEIANSILANELLSADSRLEKIDRVAKRASAIVRASISLRKSSVAEGGGKALAGKRAAQDQAILDEYFKHSELHELSGDQAATHLIDKHPEVTSDLGISHRRIANLIRKSRKM